MLGAITSDAILPSPDKRGGANGLSAEQRRRLFPRLWDTDWLVLKGMRKAIHRLADQLPLTGHTVLDLGCGAQPYAPLLSPREANYLGADLGPADEAHQIEIRADGSVDAPDGAASLVVSFQVLEHVRNLDTYLSEARRLLCTDGHLLLSTHGNWLYHPHPEDHRRWTRQGLITELAAHGFETTDCVPVVGPLGWTTMMRLTCAAVALRGIPLIGSLMAAVLAVVMNLKAMVEDHITPAWVTHDNACVYVTLSRRSPIGGQRTS